MVLIELVMPFSMLLSIVLISKDVAILMVAIKRAREGHRGLADRLVVHWQALMIKLRYIGERVVEIERQVLDT